MQIFNLIQKKYYLLLLILSFLFVTLLFLILRIHINNDFKNKFIIKSDELNNDIKKVFKDIEYQLKSLKAFYFSSDYVTREEFKIFISNFLNKKEIKRINFARKVYHRERLIFENYLKEYNKDIIGITELDEHGKRVYAKERKIYFPLTYVEPERYSEIVGYDVYSEKNRKMAIERAILMNDIVASEPLELLIKEQKGYGLIVYLPLIKGNIFNIEHCQGLLIESFYFKDIIDVSLSESNTKGIRILFYDITDKEKEIFLYESDYIKKSYAAFEFFISFFGPGKIQTINTFNFANRVYQVVLYATNKYIFENYFFYYWLIIPVLLMFMITIFLFVNRIEKEKIKADKLVFERTRELKEQMDILQNFFDVSIDLLCIANMEGKFIKLNREWERLLGIPLEQLEGKTFLDFVHPEDLEKTIDAIKELKRQKNITSFYNRYRTKDGEYRWIEWHSAPKGELIYAAARDITERIKSEEALKESEAKYKHLFDTMAQGVVYQDKNGKIFSVNKAALEILGLTYDQIMGRDSFDPRWNVIHEDGTPFPGDTHPAMIALKTGKPVTNVIMGIYHPKKNRHIWAIVNAMPTFKDESKTPNGVFATITDVTDIKEAQDALKRSEIKFRSLYNNMREGVAIHEFIFDNENKPVDYKILDVNPQYEKLTNIKAKDAIGKLATELYNSNEPPYLNEYKKILDSESFFFETYYKPLNKYFLISVAPLPEKRFATIFSDITERKLIELEKDKIFKELIKKNEELEKFVYTVSHDLKNPLITINGFTSLIEEKLKEEKINIPDVKDSLSYIKKSCENMNELLNDLLTVSRIGRVPMQFEKLNFYNIAKEAYSLIKIEAEKAEIKFIISETLKEVKDIKADKKRMLEVYQNLFSNSIKFMGSQKKPVVEAGFENGVFYVKDNGIGIEKKYLEKVFELFERLDNKVDGTGVGLAIVKRIIEAHNGRIWVESDGIGKGSVFKFTLWER